MAVKYERLAKGHSGSHNNGILIIYVGRWVSMLARNHKWSVLKWESGKVAH